VGEDPQPGFPFGPEGFDLEAVLRLFRSEGPLNWDVAQQVAAWTAASAAENGTGEGGDPPVDPADVQALSDLTRTAQLHVERETGLGAGLSPVVRTVGRREWAAELLEGLRPVLTVLAERLTADGAPDDDPTEGPEAEMAGLLTAIAPLLLGLQAGFMVGHLAARTLSRYEMPLPLEGAPGAVYVGPNVARFAREWQLPVDELRFFVALTETAHAVVHSVPWVRQRILRLARDYVSAFDVDPAAIQAQLGDFDPMDPSTFEGAVRDPAEFLGAIRSPAQQHVLADLTATVTVVEGYVDRVVDVLGARLLTEYPRVREAVRRNRVERGEATRFLEVLLGMELGRGEYERGAAFCAGVVERAGEDALARLWESEAMVPTPAELVAPGLWLARIDLPT
jgi:putative hydrolase